MMSLFLRFNISFVVVFLLFITSIPIAKSALFTASAGSISGTVTDIDTGEPLSGVSLKLYKRSGGGWQGGAGISVVVAAGEYTISETDAAGEFTFSGLPLDGEFYLWAAGDSDYLEDVYGSPAACDSSWDCDPFLGEPLSLSAGDHLTGINIALQKTGSISGRVTDVETGQPIANVNVTVCDFSGVWVNQTLTDANGDYHVGELLGRDYFLRFSTNDGPYYLRFLTNRGNYASELLGGEPSPSDNNCVHGKTVEVTLGQVTSGVDHVLQKGGSITGRVIESSNLAPLASIGVTIYSWDGYRVASFETDEDGRYQVKGLAAGRYFVKAGEQSDYINQVNSGFECQGSSCLPIILNTAVNVVPGEVISNVNFSLQKGGVISGVITASDSGVPLTDVHVEVVNERGDFWKSTSSDTNGRFQVTGLSSGNYYLTANAFAAYTGQTYGAATCAECDVLEGAPITVVEGEEIDGVDLSLQLKQEQISVPDLGSISGTVFDAESGEPISGESLSNGGWASGWLSSGNEVLVIDLDGQWVEYANYHSDGTYIVEGLVPGDYYILVSQDDEYVGELYDGVACSNPWCEKSQGTLVTVAEGQDVVGIDFSLQKGGIISGVVSTVDGKYFGDFQVSVFDVNGKYLGSDYVVDSSGYYRIIGLPEGEVFVRVEFLNYYGQFYSAYPYYEQVYPGVECIGWGCDVTKGQPVAVKLGQLTSGIDFTLQRGGEISGKITASDTGDALSHIKVEAYDNQGQLLQTGSANSKGEYKVTGLPTGQYYLKFSPVFLEGTSYQFIPLPYAADYMAELYGDVNCVGQCDVTQGKVVSVTSGQMIKGVDVALDTGDAIIGKVTAANTGAALAYTQIIIHDANGNWLGFSVWTDVNGRFSVNGLSPGNYYFKIYDSEKNGYELYGNLACDSDCVITEGTPIKIIEGQVTTAVDIVLGQADEPQSGDSSQGAETQDDEAQLDQVNNDQAQTSNSASGGGGPISWQLLLLLMLCWAYYVNSRRLISYRYLER